MQSLPVPPSPIAAIIAVMAIIIEAGQPSSLRQQSGSGLQVDSTMHCAGMCAIINARKMTLRARLIIIQ